MWTKSTTHLAETIVLVPKAELVDKGNNHLLFIALSIHVFIRSHNHHSFFFSMASSKILVLERIFMCTT